MFLNVQLTLHTLLGEILQIDSFICMDGVIVLVVGCGKTARETSSSSSTCTSSKLSSSPSNSGRVIYSIKQGDILIHSGKLHHGGQEITAGERIILVGFIDAGQGEKIELHFQDNNNNNSSN